tara:strand:- start:271 stop:384 length:114 start_codon:yes stop_codon:yes gene_type:complete
MIYIDRGMYKNKKTAALKLFDKYLDIKNATEINIKNE